MTLARFAAFVLVLTACTEWKSPAGGQTPGSSAADGVAVPVASGPPERKVSPPIAAPTDVPHARACKAHTDCAVVPVLPAADACCEQTVTAAPVTRAYLEYMANWRRSACPSDHVCAPNALPGALMADACYEGRCVAGVCDLGCNDPTYEH